MNTEGEFMELIEPEIEFEKDFEEEINEDIEPYIEIPKDFYEREMGFLKRNPVKYICDWMESNLIHIGKKVFRLICLQPCSMIIPSVPINSIDMRANINVFIIGSPSCGKSSLSKKFRQFTFFPIYIKGISAKKLIYKMGMFKGMFSISIDDFSTVLNQPDGYETIKILEGALGDEKEFSHENMARSLKGKTQAIGLICGTWTDLNKYSNLLKAGLLSRMCLLFISLTEKQRREKADFINSRIGNKEKSLDSRMKQQIISDYYKLLFKIQNKETDAERPQIQNYHFDEHLNKLALEKWKKMTARYSNDINGDFTREFQDFYRFLISHAFINIFNRKVINGTIYLTEEDYAFAMEMMEENIKNKINLIKTRLFLEGATTQEFINAIQRPEATEDMRNLLLNLYPRGQALLREELIKKKNEQERLKNLQNGN